MTQDPDGLFQSDYLEKPLKNRLDHTVIISYGADAPFIARALGGEKVPKHLRKTCRGMSDPPAGGEEKTRQVDSSCKEADLLRQLRSHRAV